MSYNRNIKNAARLINLTNKKIQVYDELTGDIVKIPPVMQIIPEKPIENDGDLNEFFIISKKTAERLAHIGRPLSDIAIASSKGLGRHNIEITRLLWGENNNIVITLCRRANNF